MDARSLSDKAEINELLSRYARAVDEQDWDLYQSVFATDATIDYSSAGAIVGGPAEVAAWLKEVFTTIPWSAHYVTNVEINVVGDSASVVAAFYNPMQLPGLTDASFCGGYYRVDVVRTPAGWRCSRLVEDNRWFLNPPAQVPPPGAKAADISFTGNSTS